MDKKEVLLANKIVFDFVLKLKEDDLRALIKGEKKIELLDNEKKLDSKKSSNIDEKIDEIINNLYSYSNKEDAIEYLNKFKVADLRKISKEANIFVKSRSKKSEIIDRVVEGTIGVKIKIEVLQF
jgi:hypothetical protein